MSREAKILLGVLVLVVGGMIALFSFNNKAPVSTGQTADQAKLVKSDSHKQGSGSVTLVEFGDYQCPACGQAYPIIKQLQSEYPGKLTLVFRNFPLTSLHKNAQVAAQAAEAAGKQDKYWEMHDKLYETQNDWGEANNAPDTFATYAGQLGLNVDQFKQGQTSDAIKSIVAADVADGKSLNVQGTPTIYVNGQQATDYTHDTLKSLIDGQLKK